ncbi:hypothetical protein DFS34DRAFT_614663 [Phlyctochytrium arcticum]|nr:hypothetical protein DFS34DRAFT_614663 [Phlyctochytrium arcticum]
MQSTKGLQSYAAKLFSLDRTILRGAIPEVDASSEGIFLVGPSESYKTSLLLRYAYSHAAQGRTVLYIHSDHNRLQHAQQFGLAGQALPSADILSLVHIRYVTNMAQLKALLAWFPTLKSKPGTADPPECIIVDQLEKIGHDDLSSESVARVVALLKLLAAELKRQTGRTCHLMISSISHIPKPGDPRTTDSVISSICLKYCRWTISITGDMMGWTMRLQGSSSYVGGTFSPQSNIYVPENDYCSYRVEEENKYIILR